MKYFLFNLYLSLQGLRASLVAQLVKNLPAMWETPVQLLGWEDPLEKGKATHSSIQAFSSPVMTLREQRQDARSDTDNYDVRNRDQKNENVGKNFSCHRLHSASTRHNGKKVSIGIY